MRLAAATMAVASCLRKRITGAREASRDAMGTPSSALSTCCGFVMWKGSASTDGYAPKQKRVRDHSWLKKDQGKANMRPPKALGQSLWSQSCNPRHALQPAQPL